MSQEKGEGRKERAASAAAMQRKEVYRQAVSQANCLWPAFVCIVQCAAVQSMIQLRGTHDRTREQALSAQRPK